MATPATCKQCGGRLKFVAFAHGIGRIAECLRCGTRSLKGASSRSKYKSREVFLDGQRFASVLESQVYQRLRYRERLGEIDNIRTQVRFPLDVDGTHVADYVADFVVYDKAERRDVIIEAKGVRTREYRMKKSLMKAVYNAEIREITYDNLEEV